MADYRDEAVREPRSGQQCLMTVAAMIAVRYRGGIPSVESLMSAYGMSRATAYRWRAAFRAAGVDEMQKAEARRVS